MLILMGRNAYVLLEKGNCILTLENIVCLYVCIFHSNLLLVIPNTYICTYVII